MAKIKTRISKPPEERREEMLEAAMRVFTQKGYEQATMRDVAKEMNVVPGLCYRYFDSKYELYRAAMTQYAKDYAAPFIELLDHATSGLNAFEQRVVDYFSGITDNEKYHSFFHKPENRDLAVVLNHTVCELVVPHMASALKRFSEAGEIKISNPEGYARFILYGIASIFDDDSKPFESRMALVDELLTKLYF